MKGTKAKEQIAYVNIKKNTSGITLIALIVTIIVLLILAGVSIMSLTGDNGILTRTGNAKTRNAIKTVEEAASLAYTSAVLDQKGTVSDATAYSQIFAELTEKGYEVKSVGGTVNNILIMDSTGNAIENLNIEQGTVQKVKVELDIENGTQKQFVKVEGKYHEIQIENKSVKVSEIGLDNLEGKDHTIKLSMTKTLGKVASLSKVVTIATAETAGIKIKIGDVEVTEETAIVSGTELTIEAGQTITDYTLGFEVEGLETKEVTVDVVANPVYGTSLTLSADKVEEEPSGTVQVSAVVNPSGTTDTVTWRIVSGDATIDSSGKVTISSSAKAGSEIVVGATLTRADGTPSTVAEQTLKITVKETFVIGETTPQEFFNFTQNEDGTVTLTSWNTGNDAYYTYYEESSKNLVLPSEVLIDGSYYTVTGIDYGALSYSDYETLVIPDTVTYIGEDAFWFNDNLKTVIIGSGVKTIGSQAFDFCYNLENITLKSNNVTSIGYSAFERTAWYENAQTEDGLVYLNNVLVGYKGSITTANIKSGTKTVADSALSHSSITSISFPDSLTHIGEQAFYSTNITSLTIPSTVKSIGYNAFGWCWGLNEVAFEDGITTIESGIFEVCTYLTKVTIPASVTNIESNAFYHCDKITDVYYEGIEEEWKAISIGSDNEYLTGATIHYSN